MKYLLPGPSLEKEKNNKNQKDHILKITFSFHFSVIYSDLIPVWWLSIFIFLLCVNKVPKAALQDKETYLVSVSGVWEIPKRGCWWPRGRFTYGGEGRSWRETCIRREASETWGRHPTWLQPCALLTQWAELYLLCFLLFFLKSESCVVQADFKLTI